MMRRGLRATTWRPWLAALAVLALAIPAAAQRNMSAGQAPVDGPRERAMKQVRLDQKLNAQLPMDLGFKDETGKDVKLGDYFDKPVMLMLIQYRCTMLCTEQMNVLIDSLKELKFTPGKQFNLLIVSIDPREKPDLAAEVKGTMLERYGRPEASNGLHFLTAEDASIKPLADAIGFHYVYDEKTDQFAHPDGVMIATPKGKVARYYFKLDYPAQGLRFGLIEAAENRIGTVIDAIALLCYHYTPGKGYGLAVINIVRMGGVATVLFLSLGVFVMKRRDRSVTPADAGTPIRVEG